MLEIEFGCGETPTREGCKTVDIRDLPGVDYVCNAWEIDSIVEKDTVDYIYSRHFFEHLTFSQGVKTLAAWKNILKPEGQIEMIIPNMSFHITQWLSRSDFQWAKEGFWGKQREGDTETWDIHKSGYDQKSLNALLIEEGFTNIRFLDTLPKNVRVVFCK